MNLRIKWLWGSLRATFWFLPLLIVAGSVALAIMLIEADATRSGAWAERWPRLFGASAAGARGMLSTIASSMMTVVGVTFSMVLVTLALASSQYTSRILRNFMADRVTQTVLGIFTGNFTYCLIVLRTIRGGEEAGFIPSLAVTFAVVLAVGGIGALILFIHHIAVSIQASSIIAAVGNETLAAIDRLFPRKLGHPPAADDGQPLTRPAWQTVAAQANGYIQSVDDAALLRLAREQGTVVRMERGIGEFVVEGTALASLARADAPEPELTAALQAAYSIRRHRTVEQDAAFGIRQLVDMALCALSPGINDTTTAVMCVDYLTAILVRLAAGTVPSPCRYEEGQLRVIAIRPTFASFVAAAFDQIRVSAKGNVTVMLQLLDALETIAGATVLAQQRDALREQVQWIAELAGRTIEAPHELASLEQRLARVFQVLAAQTAPIEREAFWPPTQPRSVIRRSNGTPDENCRSTPGMY